MVLTLDYKGPRKIDSHLLYSGGLTGFLFGLILIQLQSSLAQGPRGQQGLQDLPFLNSQIGT